MQRNRVMQATVVTAVVAAFIVTIGVTLGFAGIVLSAITLPVPLTLLWLSSDVLRADEQATTSGERLRARPMESPAEQIVLPVRSG
jgi:ABC-type spermidine/putrescine transport system permease subunit II